MGYTRTPKYRLEMAGMTFAWSGKPTQKRLEEFVFKYADSLKAGGVNEHISKALGYVPYPSHAIIVDQATKDIVVEWKAAAFQVF